MAFALAKSYEIGFSMNDIAGVQNLQKQSSESPSDVIVLFPTAMPQNPLAHWDQRFKYVLDVIKVLNDLGETKIKIKTKTGYYKKTQNNEYTFLRHILDKENFNHVEIIDGELTSCLNEAKYLVGQLTTSIIESVYSGRPYYIFEPHSMGMPNRMIDECFIKNEMISRNLMDLKSSIIEKNDADFILSKNLSGELLENINFREIISSFHGYKP